VFILFWFDDQPAGKPAITATGVTSIMRPLNSPPAAVRGLAGGGDVQMIVMALLAHRHVALVDHQHGSNSPVIQVYASAHQAARAV
jgi:hypothetical protein